jgi:hypothetical protein
MVTEQRFHPDRRSGVRITARSESDARAVYALEFSAYRLVSIEIIEDRRQLDQNHFVPNMGNWFERAIWYPRRYPKISD